jgi:hypothetical protein
MQGKNKNQNAEFLVLGDVVAYFEKDDFVFKQADS